MTILFIEKASFRTSVSLTKTNTHYENSLRFGAVKTIYWYLLLWSCLITKKIWFHIFQTSVLHLELLIDGKISLLTPALQEELLSCTPSFSKKPSLGIDQNTTLPLPH